MELQRHKRTPKATKPQSTYYIFNAHSPVKHRDKLNVFFVVFSSGHVFLMVDNYILCTLANFA